MDVKINDKFLVQTLRNCGYDNYTAIADIVDNSIEPNVGATFVKIMVDRSSERSIKSILIGDNGCGMNFPTLREALALGSETGKKGNTNFGMYGTGLKSAALSLGKKLEIITKTKNGDYSYGIFSVEDNKVMVDVKPLAEVPGSMEKQLIFDEATEFNSGTVVIISSLDKLQNRDYYNFNNSIPGKIGLYFNKIISENKIKFYHNGNEIPAVQAMWEDNPDKVIVREGSFNVEGHEVKFKLHYLPSHIEDEKKEKEDEINDVEANSFSTRTLSKSGFYLYRQNRLVGYGLTLGLYVKNDG